MHIKCLLRSKLNSNIHPLIIATVYRYDKIWKVFVSDLILKNCRDESTFWTAKSYISHYECD